MDIFEQVRFLTRLRDDFGISLDYERILTNQYMRFLRADDVVFDIGGHEGIHASKIAEIVGPGGRVEIFEPIPQLAQQLRTRHEPQASFVHVHNVALSNFHGQSEFALAQGVLAESGLKQRQFSQPGLVRTVWIQVDVGCLDDFTRDLGRLDYMKIDIEGGELDCLAGGEDALVRLRPVISLEYGAAGYRAYGYERADLWKFTERFHYCLFDILGNPIPDLRTWDQVCDRVYWDYLCVPNEKREWFTSHIGLAA
jgi:FkbM family methyltransferase